MTESDRPGPEHLRPGHVDDDTIAAVGKLSEALECVERARGQLYDMHQLIGHADLLLGEAADKLRASLKDPARKLIWSEHLGGGKEKMFSFTAKSPGLYRACVENHHAKPQRVALTIEQGWGARDYAKVGAGVFGPVEKQLDDSEHLLKDIAAEMDAALLREERLRDNSESGRDRVEFFGAVSMGVLLLTALWQIFYLRRFFRSKKLL